MNRYTNCITSLRGHRTPLFKRNFTAIFLRKLKINFLGLDSILLVTFFQQVRIVLFGCFQLIIRNIVLQDKKTNKHDNNDEDKELLLKFSLPSL